MDEVYKSRICIAGKNEIAVRAVLRLVELGLRDRLVVCPNRNDTGSSNWQPSLARLAAELEVEVVTLEVAEGIEDLLFISLEFDRIVKPARFASNRLYNIHFSRLPAYKGMYTSAHPILRGDEMSGVTLHEIDHGIDTGPIIAQREFGIGKDWTARDLYFAYMTEAYKLFDSEVCGLVKGSHAAPVAQSVRGSTYFGANSINYNDLDIDLRDTSEGIVRQLRAFSFREFQTPVIYGMKIGSWIALDRRSFGRPGTILEQGATSLVLSTIDYDLLLSQDASHAWFDVAPDTPDDKVNKLNRADIDNRNRNGWTPLIVAAYFGNTPLVEKLLSLGADPNKTNANGTTPLMYAYSSTNNKHKREVIKSLLANGADEQKTDLFGKSLAYYHELRLER